MKILKAILLGIVQGLTEFLPISSSGHLMIFESLLGMQNNNMFYNVLLHVASLMAVIIVFWKDIVELLKHPFSPPMLRIVVATIPTVILALVVNHFFDESALRVFVGFGFLISAMVVSATAIMQNPKRIRATRPLNYSRAFAIGVVQGLAVFPGISRSGSTISAGLMMGTEREEAASFSFIISIPVIIGGMIFEIIGGVKTGFSGVEALPAILGFIAAFLTALFTIKFMMKIVKKGRWWAFAVYLVFLAIFVLLNQFVLGLF